MLPCLFRTSEPATVEKVIAALASRLRCRHAQVIGQTADLYDLQRILLRSANKLGDAAQQNMTHWAVFTAASLLRKHAPEHKCVGYALQDACASGRSDACWRQSAAQLKYMQCREPPSSSRIRVG